jgi:hypothetical protein
MPRSIIADGIKLSTFNAISNDPNNHASILFHGVSEYPWPEQVANGAAKSCKSQVLLLDLNTKPHY